MINHRVDDLDALLAQLQAAGIEAIDGPQSHENCKFAWVMDPDGNKVELWEPMLWDDGNKAGWGGRGRELGLRAVVDSGSPSRRGGGIHTITRKDPCRYAHCC